MGVQKFSKEVVKEGRRVRWPKREELMSLVVVVLIVTTLAAIVLMMEDLAAARLLGAVENAFKIFKN